ncbi:MULTISPECIES: hypothetical protein [unclassified Spirosoma]|nr:MULTISPECIES: hypothetical protein [unclassified Spirosoma]
MDVRFAGLIVRFDHYDVSQADSDALAIAVDLSYTNEHGLSG